MAKKKRLQPTELELLILQVLWDDAPLPVRDIRAVLAKGGRDLAHTSVITVLNIMVDKGFLKRQKEGNAFLFSPRVDRDQISSSMTRSLIDRLFGGSSAAVVQHLLETDDLDANELVEIRKLINRKVRKQS